MSRRASSGWRRCSRRSRGGPFAPSRSPRPDPTASPAASPASIPSILSQTAYAVLYNTGPNSKTSPALSTTAGSSIFQIKCSWEYNTAGSNGDRDRSAPYDDKGNAYALIGSVSTPVNRPTAAEAVYLDRNGIRGAGHTFSSDFGDSSELSASVFEVAGAGEISHFGLAQFPGSGNAHQTCTVTGISCDGPALLIVALCLDWYVAADTPAPPNWILVNELGNNAVTPRTGDIHMLVLARQVSRAGSYDCPISVSGSEPQAATAQYFAIEASS